MERISNAPIHSNQMVSLDVVSLITKVPTDGTLTVVCDKLTADPLLEEHTCQVWQTPEEGWRIYRLKHCEYNNKDEDNSVKTLNNKKQTSLLLFPHS